MNAAVTGGLYGMAALLLALSLARSREKTKLALQRAWRLFQNVLPQFLLILCTAGLLLAAGPPELVEQVLGKGSGAPGLVLSSLLGSAVMVPVLVAFPIAAQLLRAGAGVPQVTVFLTTLTTVGLAALPLEIRYFGKKAACLRNLLAFLLAFAVAFGMEVLTAG